MTDAHIHIARRNGRAICSPYEEAIKKTFRAYAEAGITAVRDGGDCGMLGLRARTVAASAGVSFKTPICALYKQGGYGSFLGISAGSRREISRAFFEILSYKPDFIKVIASGIVSFDEYECVSEGGFSQEDMAYICSISHDHGLSVMAHCNGRENILSSIEAGADSIEHGYFAGQEELLAMKEHGVVWVPTFAPLSNYLCGDGISPIRRKVIEKILTLHSENLRFAAANKIKVAIGSDAGSPLVEHVKGAFEELESFIRAGLTQEQALLMSKESAFVLGLF